MGPGSNPFAQTQGLEQENGSGTVAGYDCIVGVLAWLHYGELYDGRVGSPAAHTLCRDGIFYVSLWTQAR